jgi:hypothetical protein
MAVSFPQSLISFVIPGAERADPEPVKSSLALARSDLERGDIREALRHLRRAAEGADEAGSVQRAVALARAAADLATEVGSVPAPALDSAIVNVAPPAALPSTSAGPLQQLLASGQAVEVVVKRSTRDEDLYVVRRAGTEAAGLGARKAIIVLLEPDDAFFEPGGSH